jgi:hypothetical protein
MFKRERERMCVLHGELGVQANDGPTSITPSRQWHLARADPGGGVRVRRGRLPAYVTLGLQVLDLARQTQRDIGERQHPVLHLSSQYHERRAGGSRAGRTHPIPHACFEEVLGEPR